MNPDEIRGLIAGGSLRPPYEIRIRDGKTYPVEDAGIVRISAAYPDMLVVASRGLGIGWISLDSIEAITSLSPGPASVGGEALERR